MFTKLKFLNFIFCIFSSLFTGQTVDISHVILAHDDAPQDGYQALQEAKRAYAEYRRVQQAQRFFAEQNEFIMRIILNPSPILDSLLLKQALDFNNYDSVSYGAFVTVGVLCMWGFGGLPFTIAGVSTIITNKIIFGVLTGIGMSAGTAMHVSLFGGITAGTLITSYLKENGYMKSELERFGPSDEAA